jgi:hypothetical protein
MFSQTYSRNVLGYHLSPNSIPIQYDVSDIKRNSDLFQRKLKVLQELEPNEKLYISDEDESLVKDNGVILIPLFVSRWWYSQGREKLLEYFQTIVADYIKLLDMLNQAGTWNSTNREIHELKEDNYKFTKSIEQGITNIKVTYPEYTEFHNEIEKILGEFVNYRILVEKHRPAVLDIGVTQMSQSVD